MVFNPLLFKRSLLHLFFIELFSLASSVFPILNSIGFFVILLITLILALRRLEWGLGIAFVELAVGSFGQLFTFSVGSFVLPLRVGIFLIIIAVWLARFFTHSQRERKYLKSFFSLRIGKCFVAFGVVVVIGLVHGLIRNSFANTFFDANNWLFFLYILPGVSVFSSLREKDFVASKEKGFQSNIYKDRVLTTILTLFAAASLMLALKTIIIEWFFAHQVPGTIEMLYRWIRDYRLGEITFFAQNFYRVFLQSHIWLVFSFFIFLSTLSAFKSVAHKNNEIQNKKITRSIIILLLCIATALIISFSRSLWLGWAAGTGVFFLLLIMAFKWPFNRVLKWAGSFLGALVGIGLVIVALINIPPVKERADFAGLFSDRLTIVEAAGSSRINLLKPLWHEIQSNPIIGYGFGKTITYRSADPRVVAATAGASGEYTTYAFEWGYLDIWLKLGVIGLLVYLGLLFELAKILYKKFSSEFLIPHSSSLIPFFGLFLSFVALVVINIFTPYLNHPLGIGFVILTALTVYTLTESKNDAKIF